MTKTLQQIGLCSMFLIVACFCGNAQRVAPDVERLVAVQNDTAEYVFTSYRVPVITGPSANLGSGYIELGLISGNTYVLRYHSTSTISTEGWPSDLKIYPYEGDNSHTVQRVKMITQLSIVDAHTDYLRVPMGTMSVDVDILSNDYSTNNDLLVEEITIVNNGSAELIDSTQILRFWPEADFEGIARVQYLACDDNKTCDLTAVTIYMYNPADTIQSDTLYVESVNTKKISVPLPWPGFSVQDLPSNGDASIDTLDWIVNYQAYPDFAGNDTITVSDGVGFTRTIIVEVLSVAEENGFAVDDVFYPAPGRTAILDVYANDFYQVLNMDTFLQPQNGSLLKTSVGTFFYSPDDGFEGIDRFSYTVCNGAFCEEAQVHLFVGKQEPKKEIEHVISIAQQDVSRIIDIQNSMAYYSLNIVDPPSRGSAELRSFYFDRCRSGFNYLNNQLIYWVPDSVRLDQGNVLDTFTVEYCLQNLTECDTVQIVMDIYDENRPFCCNVDCVWPGDANADGWVDMSDLLQLGMFIGEEGASRLNQDPEVWKGQSVTDWRRDRNNVDPKHADTDGNGVITHLDTTAMKRHYNRVNNIVANKSHLLETIPMDMGHDDVPRDSGDLVVMEVLLGSVSDPALSIYGLSFTIDYPVEHVDSSSKNLTFPEHTWLLEGAPTISMDMETKPGFIDGGVTRLDQFAASGYGQVAVFDFIIVDDLDGIRDVNGYVDVPIRLTNVIGSRGDGSRFALPDVETTVRLNRTAKKETPEPADVYVFPNPAVDQLTIHLNGQNALESYRLYDFTGRLVQTGVLNGKRDQLILNQALEGMYALQLLTENGSVTKKVKFAQQ